MTDLTAALRAKAAAERDAAEVARSRMRRDPNSPYSDPLDEAAMNKLLARAAAFDEAADLAGSA